MTVAALIAKLQKLSPTLQVVISTVSAPPDGVQPSVSNGDDLFPIDSSWYPQHGQVRIPAAKSW